MPRTKLPYDSRDIAYLHYDIDVDDLFRTFPDMEGDSRKQAKAVIKYLDTHEPITNIIKKEKVLVRREYATGKVTPKQLAARYGRGLSTIYRWLKET